VRGRWMLKIFSVVSNSISSPARSSPMSRNAQSSEMRGLLHVVRDDDDRDALLQLGHQVLDLQRRDGVQGRRGLVHQEHLGVHGEGASDAQALLLATGEVGRRDFQSALHAVPESRDLSDVSAASSRIDFFFTPLKRSPETAFS